MGLYEYRTTVPESWLDYNGHMNDGQYSRAFSDAGLEWMKHLGLDGEKVKALSFTTFTLENHIVYQKEVFAGEEITIKIRIYDFDAKRMHVFMSLHNEEGTQCATYEVMYMGMDTETGRPGEFPEVLDQAVKAYYDGQGAMETPKEIGRMIGIRR
ncbi:thioesterase family protein [Lacicoccus alkaliphilus]|uniref:Acyl-CoA thioester hydrolase n=1 Tax=Lacicoccus alkaliphilus DSM 16010 TaxID=1123231 RepID=A0A1M7ASM5_9BACL|nr:thioesterase family protein [Salinicoccus alkaliphilus]SHL45723.1 acyl-CoA thioester hydrolase [Salinicoccus alkaliphilus DSM 16010]